MSILTRDEANLLIEVYNKHREKHGDFITLQMAIAIPHRIQSMGVYYSNINNFAHGKELPATVGTVLREALHDAFGVDTRKQRDGNLMRAITERNEYKTECERLRMVILKMQSVVQDA